MTWIHCLATRYNTPEEAQPSCPGLSEPAPVTPPREGSCSDKAQQDRQTDRQTQLPLAPCPLPVQLLTQCGKQPSREAWKASNSSQSAHQLRATCVLPTLGNVRRRYNVLQWNMFWTLQKCHLVPRKQTGRCFSLQLSWFLSQPSPL